MVLMAYRHGLRVSELCDLQWSDIDFKAGTIYVRRQEFEADYLGAYRSIAPCT